MALIGIGLWASRRVHDAADFLLAGRKLGPWVAGLSYAASTSSAWVLLGFSGFMFAQGVAALWMLPGIWGGYVAVWLWLGPKIRQETAAQQWVTPAQANLDRTLANYEAFLAGPTAAQIAGAEAGVAQAESSLANLMDGPTDESIAVAEAQVAQAEINLANAQESLADTSITAPFDGIITAVNFVEGEFASGPVLSIISSDFVVVLNVDEIDIGSVEEGQPAEITLETWPDEAIPASVGEIAPSATVSNNGLVTYEVQLVLDDTELPVRAGMTANAELITANRENVLLVPNGAVRADRQNEQYFVNIASTDEAGVQTFTEIEVTIGLRDNDFTQITSGLSDGDEVLIGALEVPVFEFGGGPFGGGGDDE